MIKKVIYLMLLFSSQIAAIIAKPTPDRFMNALPKDRKLKDLSLLGAHHAGTYALHPSMGVSPDEYGNFIYTIGNVPILGKAIDWTIIKAWSQTQKSTITSQLNKGVRYFDLHFAPDANGNFRICHGLFGPLFDDILSQINTFLNSHPKEIVLLDFTFFDHQGKKLTWDQQNQIVSQIQQTFGTKIAPSSYGIGVTLGQMWQGKKQAILFWKDSTITRVHPDLLWNRSACLVSTLYSKANWDDLQHSLNQGLALRNPDKFYVNQAILTPDANMIITHLFSSLLSIEKETNTSALIWYAQKAMEKLSGNILMLDNVDSVYTQAFQISMKYNLR